jgi:hypothetical protein
MFIGKVGTNSYRYQLTDNPNAYTYEQVTNAIRNNDSSALQMAKDFINSQPATTIHNIYLDLMQIGLNFGNSGFTKGLIDWCDLETGFPTANSYSTQHNPYDQQNPVQPHMQYNPVQAQSNPFGSNSLVRTQHNPYGQQNPVQPHMQYNPVQVRNTPFGSNSLARTQHNPYGQQNPAQPYPQTPMQTYSMQPYSMWPYIDLPDNDKHQIGYKGSGTIPVPVLNKEVERKTQERNQPILPTDMKNPLIKAETLSKLDGFNLNKWLECFTKNNQSIWNTMNSNNCLINCVSSTALEVNYRSKYINPYIMSDYRTADQKIGQLRRIHFEVNNDMLYLINAFKSYRSICNPTEYNPTNIYFLNQAESVVDNCVEVCNQKLMQFLSAMVFNCGEFALWAFLQIYKNNILLPSYQVHLAKFNNPVNTNINHDHIVTAITDNVNHNEIKFIIDLWYCKINGYSKPFIGKFDDYLTLINNNRDGRYIIQTHPNNVNEDHFLLLTQWV